MKSVMERFEVSPLEDERGLRLTGELDLHSAPRLNEALAGLQGTGEVKLDVSELTFIDSSGMHAMVEYASAENGSGNGRLILEGVSPTLLRIFEITRLAEHPGLDIRLRTDGD